MRRWMLTALLALVATISALLTVRLMPADPQTGCRDPLPAVQHNPVDTGLAPVEQAQVPTRVQSVIPEATQPITPPAEVVPEHFWADVPKCGMG